jgi:hypothetical protein
VRVAWQHEGVDGCWPDGFLGVGFQMSVDKRERERERERERFHA